MPDLGSDMYIMKNAIIKLFIKVFSKRVWRMSGDIAERFHDKGTGECDDLQEKLYYWITDGLIIDKVDLEMERNRIKYAS